MLRGLLLCSFCVGHVYQSPFLPGHTAFISFEQQNIGASDPAYGHASRVLLYRIKSQQCNYRRILWLERLVLLFPAHGTIRTKSPALSSCSLAPLSHISLPSCTTCLLTPPSLQILFYSPLLSYITFSYTSLLHLPQHNRVGALSESDFLLDKPSSQCHALFLVGMRGNVG